MLFIFLSSSLKDGSLEDDSDEDTENEEPDNRDYVSVLRFVLEDVSSTFNACTHTSRSVRSRVVILTERTMCGKFHWFIPPLKMWLKSEFPVWQEPDTTGFLFSHNFNNRAPDSAINQWLFNPVAAETAPPNQSAFILFCPTCSLQILLMHFFISMSALHPLAMTKMPYGALCPPCHVNAWSKIWLWTFTVKFYPCLFAVNLIEWRNNDVAL